MRIVFFGHGFVVKSILKEARDTTNVVVYTRTLERSNYQLIYFDITQSKKDRVHLKNDDIVIYSIALKTPGSNYSSDDLDIELTSLNLLLDICDQFNVARVILFSSASVYGFSDQVITEESSYNPISTYGTLKVEMEKVFLDRMAKTSF